MGRRCFRSMFLNLLPGKQFRFLFLLPRFPPGTTLSPSQAEPRKTRLLLNLKNIPCRSIEKQRTGPRSLWQELDYKQELGEAFGGGRGIRTPVTLSGKAVFKTACFNRSHIPPHECYQ